MWLFIQLFELFDQYERGKISRWTLGESMVTATEQAKAMHRNEIEDAYIQSMKDNMIAPLDFEVYKPEADEYYNETFEK